VINTHFHDDHADGNREFGPGSTVVASANARRRLLHLPAPARPTVTTDEQLSLHLNGEEIRLMYFPNAHTDSDLVVHFVSSNVFHLGDLFNAGNDSFPTVDLDAGGSLDGLIEALEELLEIIPPGAKIIPGHYGLSDAGELRTTLTMLVETVSFVRRAEAAGLSLEEVQKRGLPDSYREWGKTGYTGAGEWIANIFSAIERGQ
jgi:glyoxylase-like metal-dependent hydrolase (beta-lactamase superfamily II)